MYVYIIFFLIGHTALLQVSHFPQSNDLTYSQTELFQDFFGKISFGVAINIALELFLPPYSWK